MSTIVQLDKSYDVWLSYSWSNNNHGICGHTYEVIDYYYILKNHFKVGILLCEDIDWDMLEKTIRYKYDFTEEEIEDIKSNTLFHNRPKVVAGTKIIFTDGGVVNMKSKTLLFDKIYYMACGNKEIKDNTDEKVYILQDNRVYHDIPKVNGINYVKKILFDKIKKPETVENNVLIYATKNCRNIEDFKALEEYKRYGSFLIITNEENRPKGLVSVVPPIDNIFSLFSTYVYTPIQRKWDCSPRFLAECKYFNKKVVYHDITYWQEDLGLWWRKYDIEFNFPSLHLTDNDSLIDLLNV